MRLTGARVLVVGATGELGSRIARRLADGGCVLAVTGRRTDRLAEVATQVRARWQQPLDLVDLDGCRTAVVAAAEALGGLDGLVVASGVASFGSAADEEDAVVEEVFAVNVLGPMAVVRAALPRLEAGGCVAVLTAVLADVPTAGMAAYSASKAAISAYVTAVRREVRRRQVTVLDARPPHLETGLADRALAGMPPTLPPGHDVDEVVELVVRGIAEGRSELVADLKARTVMLR